MDPRNWQQPDVPRRYGSYTQFDGTDGSTPIFDQTQCNRNEVDGPYINLPGFGGTSQYVGQTMEDPDMTEVPGEERRGRKGCRSKNFSDKEDRLLISAWINVGQDAVHGTNQSSATYWGRIHTYFHEYKDFFSDRNQKSLISRWSVIQGEVSKFCGFFAQIESRNQSGVTHQNKLASAMSMYEEMEKKKFMFVHCFDVLKNNQKWQLWQQTQSNKKQKSSVAASPASSKPGGNYVNLDEEAEDDGKNVTPRPMGNKAAKSLRRRAASSSSTWNESVMKASSESINSQLMENEHKRQEMFREQHDRHEKGLQERRETMVAMQREKIRMQKEIKEMELQQNERLRLAEIEAESKRRREEKRMKIEEKRMENELRELNMIMQLDLSKLDDDAREYYQSRKKKLLANQRKGE